MLRLSFLFLLSLLMNTGFSQYNWKLEKQKDGIIVYLSDIVGSNYKAVRVECTMTGTYAKLITLVSNVADFNKWIYNTKRTKLIERKSAFDFIYYTETYMPWLLSNRDLAIHVRIKTDSLPRFLIINGADEKTIVPEILGKVRVPHYKANWKVTMLSANTIHISYILEVNPGGNISAWMANSFADKGPFETFSNLVELLKK